MSTANKRYLLNCFNLVDLIIADPVSFKDGHYLALPGSCSVCQSVHSLLNPHSLSLHPNYQQKQIAGS